LAIRQLASNCQLLAKRLLTSISTDDTYAPIREAIRHAIRRLELPGLTILAEGRVADASEHCRTVVGDRGIVESGVTLARQLVYWSVAGTLNPIGLTAASRVELILPMK
jgi:hypothetical protein